MIYPSQDHSGFRATAVQVIYRPACFLDSGRKLDNLEEVHMNMWRTHETNKKRFPPMHNVVTCHCDKEVKNDVVGLLKIFILKIKETPM